METVSRPEIVGRPLTDVAEEWGCHPLDVLLQVAVDDKLETRVGCTLANDDVEGVGVLLQQDSCTLGLSDAGAHVGQLCDAPQATDFLGNWVRDRDLMPIEQAVRKLSGVQADILGLAIARHRHNLDTEADVVEGFAAAGSEFLGSVEIGGNQRHRADQLGVPAAKERAASARQRDHPQDRGSKASTPHQRRLCMPSQ